MSTHFLSFLFHILHNRILVHLHKFKHRFFGHILVCSELLATSNLDRQVLAFESISLNRILIGKSPCSRKLIHTTVRTRRCNIMLDVYKLAIDCANECKRLFAILHSLCFCILAMHTKVSWQRYGVAVHCNKCLHAVATMNV